jgi:hypothetical protein
MRALARLWRGEVPLDVAFWNWAVLGGLAINITTTLLFLVLITMGEPIAALIAGYAFSVPYNVLVTVGVWRAAGRHSGDQRWARAARAITLLGMLILSAI